MAELPAGLGNLGFAEAIFNLTQELPYDFGVVTQLLNETDRRFNTGSMRNIYSPDVRVANELVIDQLARAMGKDPLKFRLEFVKDDRVQRRARGGRRGRRLGPVDGSAARPRASRSTRSTRAARRAWSRSTAGPQTVNRKVRDGVTGPRVTKRDRRRRRRSGGQPHAA